MGIWPHRKGPCENHFPWLPSFPMLNFDGGFEEMLLLSLLGKLFILTHISQGGQARFKPDLRCKYADMADHFCWRFWGS